MNYETSNLLCGCSLAVAFICPGFADEPMQGDSKTLKLVGDTTLELVYIPPGKFIMGSTAEEKKWATGIEGGAQPGTVREEYEGNPRPMHVKQGFWIGRTEVTRGQFRQFVEETGYVTDAEKPGGMTQVFDHQWDRYYRNGTIVHPWKSVADKGWRASGSVGRKTYDAPEGGSCSEVPDLHRVKTTAHFPRRSR